MKNRVINKFIAIGIILLASLSVISCSNLKQDNNRFDFSGENDVGALEDSQGAVELEYLENLSEYCIIRSDTGTREEKQTALALRDAIKKSIGVDIPVGTDWQGETGRPIQDKEILVGVSEREESVLCSKGLGVEDFIIKMVGEKLVIVGGSERATAKAVDFYIENFFDAPKGAVKYPRGNGYLFIQENLFESLSISGTALSEYALYSTDPDIDLEYVRDKILENITGTSLKIADTLSDGGRYVIFDNSHLLVNHYGTKLDAKGNLTVYGSYKTFDTALDYFLGDFFAKMKSDNGSYDVRFSDCVDLKIEDARIYTKEQLLSALTDVYNDESKIIIGEQLGSSQAMPKYALEEFKKATGEYPAMLGVDLGEYGLYLSRLSGAERSQAICELYAYAASGGIITVCSHSENPTENWTEEGRCRGYIGGDDGMRKILTEGNFAHDNFVASLTLEAEFLKALSDNGIPVLYRPYHETNGEGFWFSAVQGEDTIDAGLLCELWVYTYEFFASRGIGNMLWVFSATSDGDLPPLYAYPGGKYVDILGVDIDAQNKKALLMSGSAISELAAANKPVAISEYTVLNELTATSKEEQAGLYSGEDVLNSLYDLIDSGKKISYFMTWNGMSRLSWLSGGAEFMSDSLTLSAADMAEIFFGDGK